jgi:hypothetical protein
MVARPEEYRWSSYRATVGLEPAPEWLTTRWVLQQFGAEPKKRPRGTRPSSMLASGSARQGSRPALRNSSRPQTPALEIENRRCDPIFGNGSDRRRPSLSESEALQMPFFMSFVLAGLALVSLSCARHYSYTVGFTSCVDELIRMEVASPTFKTELPVSLRKGQLKAEDAIEVQLPRVMRLEWTVGGSRQVKTYEIADVLPVEFNGARDALWFVACPVGPPRLFASVSFDNGIETLFELTANSATQLEGSVRNACRLCEKRSASEEGVKNEGDIHR